MRSEFSPESLKNENVINKLYLLFIFFPPELTAVLKFVDIPAMGFVWFPYTFT